MNDLTQYGPIGVVATIGIAAIVAVFTWGKGILKDAKDEREKQAQLHREEREQLRKTIENQFDTSNKVASNAAQALTELTMLLRNRK